MKINILRNISFSFALLLLSGCYTIVDYPIDYIHIDSSNDDAMKEFRYFANNPDGVHDAYYLDDDGNKVWRDYSTVEDSSSDNYSSDEYIIINNYHCDHHNNNCHSHSNYYGCCDHHLSYNWWTGHYSCSSYYWNGYNNYAHGYYYGYWWGHNSWWWNNSWWWDTGGGSSNDYADNDQERRDRSFERLNEGSDDTENDYSFSAIEYLDNSKKSVTPVNYKKHNRKSLPPKIDSKNKPHKKKYKKKENKGSGLIEFLFGSKETNSKGKSTSSSSSSSYKSEDSNKSDSKKSNSKNNRKQRKGRR